jgi:hypothetical protein
MLNAIIHKLMMNLKLTNVGGDTGLLEGFDDVGFRVVGFVVPLTPPQCSTVSPHQPCWLQHCP